MLLEDILMAVAIGAVLIICGFPIVRMLKTAPWRRQDPLAAAQERLRIAKLEAEIAKVNREAEEIYDKLYAETITADRGGGRVDASEESVSAGDQGTGKGRRSG